MFQLLETVEETMPYCFSKMQLSSQMYPLDVCDAFHCNRNILFGHCETFNSSPRESTGHRHRSLLADLAPGTPLSTSIEKYDKLYKFLKQQ